MISLLEGTQNVRLRPTSLTVEEAVKMVRASKSTIHNRLRDGSLPAKRLRGVQTVIIELPDLLALLEDARLHLEDKKDGRNG